MQKPAVNYGKKWICCWVTSKCRILRRGAEVLVRQDNNLDYGSWQDLEAEKSG